jgi:predicted nucleic acid-binding protein
MRVVDANVALAWAVPSAINPAAMDLLAQPLDLVAPMLLVHEVTNACRLMVKTGHVDLRTAHAIRRDAMAPIRLAFDDAALAARALEIATELDHPAYDCFYIAAAETADTTLITADRRLLAKITGTAYADRVIELGA